MNHPDQPDSPKNVRVAIVQTIAIWLAVAVSISNLGVILFRGGALVQKVDSHDHRLDKLETDGSNNFRSHEAADREWVAAFNSRLARDETDIASLTSIVPDVREIKTDLQWIKKNYQERLK